MRHYVKYTYEAKNWWENNSDNLKVDWDTFCTIWMASLNSKDVDIEVAKELIAYKKSNGEEIL